MDRKLPPLRDVLDMSESRGTPAPPNAAWTAINHQPEGPVSPRTRHANPPLNGRPSPPSHHQDCSEHPTLPHGQTTTTSSKTGSIYAGAAFDGHPARFFPAEHQTAGKPITARQDSAVFSSATSQAPSSFLTGNSSRSGRSPEFYHVPARDTATHPLTPPSDPLSLQSYSRSVPTQPPPFYGRPPLPLSTGPQQETIDMDSQRRSERGDSDVSSPDVPLLPRVALFHERSTMPPPPVPPSTLPSESLLRESSLLSSSTGFTEQVLRYYPDDHADAEASMEKCEYCNAVWTYPPPDTEGVPLTASRTPQEMQRNMGVLTTRLADYRSKKDADFVLWKQRHSGGHCDCMDHQAGRKRKLEESIDNTSPHSKIQKRASGSPPRASHLTPPPDQANGEAASELSHSNPKADLRLPPATARILGDYIPPSHDVDNMFHDPHGERKTVKTEEAAH